MAVIQNNFWLKCLKIFLLSEDSSLVLNSYFLLNDEINCENNTNS